MHSNGSSNGTGTAEWIQGGSYFQRRRSHTSLLLFAVPEPRRDGTLLPAARRRAPSGSTQYGSIAVRLPARQKQVLYSSGRLK